MKAPKDIESLTALIEELRRLPGLPFRNVNRIALGLLRRPETEVKHFCDLIIKAQGRTKPCETCFALTENTVCFMCQDESRNKTQVCVIASWLEFFTIKEAATDYNGLFHVLGGLISPLEGIGSADLSVNLLLERLNDGNIKELIFALSPTPEGEVTISYIQALIGNRPNLTIFKIASGIPVGTNLEHADRSTLLQAFAEKRLV